MNIFDLNDLDESHATSQDLDEHARNRCDAQWFFLFQFVASDAGVCSQCLKIAVDLMWILGPLEVVNITMQVFLWQKVFGYHPWSYLYYWTILTDAGSDVCMVPVQRRQNSLCFCGAPCQTVEKKQLLQILQMPLSSRQAQVFICFDDFLTFFFMFWWCSYVLTICFWWISPKRAESTLRLWERWESETVEPRPCNVSRNSLTSKPLRRPSATRLVRWSSLVIVGLCWRSWEIFGCGMMWDMGIDG